jgi:hypothetical protein
MPPEYFLTRRPPASARSKTSSSSPARPGRGAAEAEQPGEQDQVLAPRELLVDRGELARQADEAPHGVGLAHDVVPEHACDPRVGTQQRGQHTDRRGLARPVGTQDAVDRARRHGELHAVHGAHGAEGLDEARGLYRQLAHRSL